MDIIDYMDHFHGHVLIYDYKRSNGLQDTYTFSVDSDPGQTAFEGFDVDLDSRLSSVTGNVDL